MNYTFNNIWCVDRLIVGCLTSSDKYFMHIQDENRFNKDQYRKRGGMGHNRATVFDYHWEEGVMGREGEIYSVISFLFFEKYKRDLLRALSVAFSTHVNPQWSTARLCVL